MRFGVVSSPDGRLRDWHAACLKQLELSGVGLPVWAMPGRPAAPHSWCWSFYSAAGERFEVPVPNWWTQALTADRRAPVDFVVSFSPSTPIASAAASAPRFGVWYFDLGDPGPPGWRAMVKGRSSVRVRLCADIGNAQPIVLQEGALPVSLCFRESRSRIHEVLAQWPARAAAEIIAGGWSQLPRGGVDAVGRPPPSNGELLGWLLVQPWRRLWDWWRHTTRYDTWNVGTVAIDAPIRELRQLGQLADVRWLPPRRRRYFLADPFPYRYGGRSWLLVEEHGYPRSARSRISRLDITGGSADPKIEPAIVRDGHLSYPYTFHDAQHTYCAPEMSQHDGCIVYRLDEQGSWEPCHHVLPGREVVDPTFFRFEDRWWLLYTDKQAAGSLVLYAHYAGELAGPWAPHALNPLKWDLSSARPAGRVFALGGRLYRPAQDCSETYGGATVIMEILELTPSRFRETPALRLEPDRHGPYPHGLHHLVVEADRIYLDGKTRSYDNLLWLKNLFP